MLRHWSIIKLSCLKMCYCMLLCKQLQHEANLARDAADAERARANQAKNEAAAAEQAKAAAGFAAAEKEAEDELKKATEKVSETFAATSNASAAADGDTSKQARAKNPRVIMARGRRGSTPAPSHLLLVLKTRRSRTTLLNSTALERSLNKQRQRRCRDKTSPRRIRRTGRLQGWMGRGIGRMGGRVLDC